MKKTVLVVIGDVDVGGTEHHLVRVLSRLSRQRCRPLVYTLSHKGSLAPELKAAGIRVVAPPGSGLLRGRAMRRTLLLAVSILRLITLMLRERPLVVHFLLPEAYLVGGLSVLLARCRFGL